MLVAEFDYEEGVISTGYNPKIEIIATWVNFKSTNKPKLVDMVK